LSIADIFITGATGVLGRATVPLLINAGYTVRGLARSQANEGALRQLGADPVRADLVDTGGIRPAVEGCEAILHLATRIPPMARLGRRSAWEENDRIRREGTRILVNAAREAGVRTVVYPSVILVYPDSGDRWVDATTTGAETAPILESTLDAEAQIARFTESGGRGIVLRMGLFYGPESTQTQGHLSMARRGISLIPGSPEGYMSSIWIQDAAEAVVAAMAALPAGVYDVVDDEPQCRGEVVEILARSLGRRSLRAVPPLVFRLTAPAVASHLMRSQRVSNRRFKEATGWAPRVSSAAVGWRMLVSGDVAPAL